jgi:thiol-disulfide isomerase/thioredoxin
MMKKSLIVLSLMLITINIIASTDKISAGPWRFVLQTNHADIPFLIDFKYKGDNLVGVLHNGKESINLNNITLTEGEISIPLQNYELSLQLTPKDKETLVGNLVRHNKNPIVKTPVIGVHGIKERFTALKNAPTIDINGKWALVMKDEKDQSSPGIGIFTQKDGRFTGSILTQTGDYRYLEGYVSENNFEAASFDGVYNYVFKGNLKDGKMQAGLLSNSTTKITGQLDAKAELPDAYKQTEIKELKFIFPDLKGQSVTLNHPKFKNKPVIVQIYGSWCPNCIDEMNFLIPWYEKNNKRGVEIVALAFERSLSIEEATRQLLKVQKKLNVPYVILQAGSTAEDKPSDKLPGLTNFISFPTTIFLNKKHEVVKVHAGFNGPSTGEYFEKWKVEFNQTIDALVK